MLGLGRVDMGDQGSHSRCPSSLIHTSDHYNGVSKLHGEVSRKMWQGLWPELPTDEVPIESITNGVHTASWVASEMGALFTRYLGPRWAEQCDDKRALGARLEEIPDAELWQVARTPPAPGSVQHARRWLRAAAGTGAAPLARTVELADERCSTRTR